MRTQIIDLDGCISDDRWRLPFINHDHPDPFLKYEQYHSRLGEDQLRNAKEVWTQYRIVVITSRPTTHEDATKAWLARHGIRPAILLMRGRYDYRESALVKRSALEMLFGVMEYDVERSDIVDAIDDREDVINMYRKSGLPARLVRIE